MSNSLDKLIESAVLSYLGTQITGVSIRAWRDNSSNIPEKGVFAHVYDRNNTENSPGLWDFKVALIALTLISTDKNKSILNSIYASLESVAETLLVTPATISVTGYSTHAFLFSSEEDGFLVEQDFQTQTAILQIFVEKQG